MLIVFRQSGISRNKMKAFSIIFSFFYLSVCGYGQKLPLVNVNHFYIVIDSADVAALQQSNFVKDTLAALVTRTTKADSSAIWTGTYLEGLDNYLEIFNSAGFDEPLGNAGIAFSVDKIGEINQLDSILSKKYATEMHLREKQYDDRNVPWFTGLGIKDSVFDATSHISFWVMEYKPEYYNYNHWKYGDNRLTRLTYLAQYEKERQNKLVKRFTGITCKITEKERKTITEFLTICGYRKIGDDRFLSPENFEINLINTKANDRYTVTAISFECNKPENKTVKISENIQVILQNKKGKITLK